MKQKINNPLTFKLVFFVSFLLFFSFILITAYSEEILIGNIAQPGFREGLRIQYNINTGGIIGVFDMRRTNNDDMLIGIPDPDVSHLDFFTNYELEFLVSNYEFQQYIDLETNSINITPKQN